MSEMQPTVERPSYSDEYPEWLKKYAPEYPVENQIKGGGRQKTVPELKPWSYWSQPIDPAGIIYVVDPEEPVPAPWTRQVMEVPFVAAMDKANYYRNGGKTPIGGEGLDPKALAGATLTKDAEGNTAADGPNGQYVWQHGTGDDAVPATHSNGYVSDALSNTNTGVLTLDYRSEEHLKLVGDNQHRFGADPPE